MDITQSTLILAALSQSTRLEAFRLLVASEPDGMPAGGVASALAVPQNTMSAHLGVLARAGLVSSARNGRTILYRADVGRLGALIVYLTNDCCGGRPDLCGPLVAALTPCCSTKETCNV